MGGLAEYLAGENDGPGGMSMPGGPNPLKPCRKCGGEKTDPLRGSPYCGECRELAKWQAERKARSPRQVCVNCKRAKEPGHGRRLCEACRAKPAPTCRMCPSPPRAPGKALCETCFAISKERGLWRRKKHNRKRREENAERVREEYREHNRRRYADPATRERDLELRRMRYRRKQAEMGRTIRGADRPVAGTPFELPARPLARAFAVLAERSDLGTVCDLASVAERAVSRWRTGGVETVDSDEADAILTALDLLWWEVWNEDTTRRPLFVVHDYVHSMKTTNGVRKMRRVKHHRWHYGDEGPDLEALAEIAARMTGTAVAA